MKIVLSIVLLTAMAALVPGEPASAQFKEPGKEPTIGSSSVTLPLISVQVKTPYEAVSMVEGNLILSEASARFVPYDEATALYVSLGGVKIMALTDFSDGWMMFLLIPMSVAEMPAVTAAIEGVTESGLYVLKITIAE